jgi:parvulin-like peptidyl-prolyl isomerase
VQARAIAVAASVSLLLAVLVGCGGADPSPTAIRVGDVSISRQRVDHWTAIITRGALVAEGPDESQQPPRQQALTFLIESAWLHAEAARSGLSPSRAQVARIVAEQRSSATDGAAGFAAALAETGQTLADVEQEAAARLEAKAVTQQLAATAERDARKQVTGREVAKFYRSHLASYHLREQRFYDLHEQIPTRRQAVALGERLGAGARFSVGANKEKPFRPRSFENLPGQAAAFRAVFAAKKTGAVVGPVPLQGSWCIFVLRRIAPARLQPLSEVRGAIERQLLAPVRRRVRAQLLGAYRRRWVAQTACHPGFIVQQCRQYRGARKPEEEPFLGV